MRDKPNIVVIGTGGTIAGRGESTADTSAYTCSVLEIGEVLAAIPEASSIATLRAEQLLQLGSENFANPHLLMIGKRIAAVLADDAVDAVILTHGTDAIEETAYFLHLTLKSAKPVVVVGAMRPPSAMSSDASLNLYHAICVAAHPSSRGLGTLVVANDEIHTARDVSKTSSFKLEAFRSPYGALGHVSAGKPRYYRKPARDHTTATPWSIERIDALPKVDILYGYGALEADAVRAMASRADGIVFAGTGNGNIAAHLIEPLRDASNRGVRIVRASRTANGTVIRNGALPDDDFGWAVIDDQPPPKARILLMLALLDSDLPNAIQSAFYRY